MSPNRFARHLRVLAAGILTVVVAVPALNHAAGRLFKGLTSTAGGYATWDADLIDVEDVAQTGSGVYVAVLDTGLVPHWRDYFPEARVATQLGTGFHQPIAFAKAFGNPCAFEIAIGTLRQAGWVGSTGSTHGTHVASTILGYEYRSNFDALGGFPLPPVIVRGIAPDVTVIPVKVLSDYQIPALPNCSTPIPAQTAVFGTSEAVAAGIDYVTNLALAGYRPMVINMSLGGGALDPVEQTAIDRAIANGVIVVAAAGNEGEEGMSYPGAYAPVISAGSAGWTGEWLRPGSPVLASNRYRLWWLKYPFAPLFPNSGEVADPTAAGDVYISDFSSRAIGSEQELDVVAPGSWVRGPFPGDPGFAHLPWWSRGIGDLVSHNPGNFYYVGGTSMATPHVASVAARMVEKNPLLTQALVEAILRGSAFPVAASGSRVILDNTVVTTVSWDALCGSVACDAVGAGLVNASGAVAAVPEP